MRLADVVATSRAVAATNSRLEKIDHLAGLLARVPPDAIAIVVPFLSGALRQGRIGVGGALLRALGDVPPADAPALDVAEVDAAFDRAASAGRARGAGAPGLKNEVLRQLMGRATRDEQDFLARLLFGELRQGALEGVLVEAIAKAGGVDAARVRRAAMLAGDVAPVAQALLGDRDTSLSRFVLRPFQPVQPMLADSAADVGEALSLLGGTPVSFEHKLDGARIQVHKGGEQVRIYTRALNEVTAALPEIVAAVRALPAEVLILDGEAIAFDAAGRPHPFQITMRRFGRRLRVEKLREELPIRAFFFDCVRVDGDSLADRPARERIAALTGSIPGELAIPRLVTASVAEASAFYDAALTAGHEGLMAKSLEGPYEAGNRGASWLKIKRAHTLDLVVLAAEWGSGRRSGKLSNLHLGARDPETGAYVMLGKTFKGLTDAMLEWQTRRFLELETHRDASTVYVRPEVVVEIAFSDLQASPRYAGGLALRLARVKRYREDKSPAEADSMAAVRRIAAAQAGAPLPP